MGSVLRISSGLLSFVVCLSMPLVGSSTTAQLSLPDRPRPAKGSFDWTRFKGKYEIGECHSRPSAIWGDGPSGTFVQIDHKVDYSLSPTTRGLQLTRASNRNPIALGWSIERVGQGRRTETNARTGKVDKAMESYATTDGVYGMMAWDRPHNVGWSTLQLRQNAEGNISFTIRQRTDSDASTREETCALKKYVPDDPRSAT